MTDSRERRLKNLPKATGENTEGKALDCAADYYLKMAWDTTAIPTGAVKELMERAVDQDSVTPAEIAEVLITDKLPVEAEIEWSVGEA
jgi:hypothetical protein